MQSASAKRPTSELSNAYLRQVAYTHVVNEIRRRSRRAELPLDRVEERGTLWMGPNPHSCCEYGELSRSIERCLREMVKPRRQAVSLWLDGYDTREIAMRMAWDSIRAQNLLTRGRGQLRRSLTLDGSRP